MKDWLKSLGASRSKGSGAFTASLKAEATAHSAPSVATDEYVEKRFRFLSATRTNTRPMRVLEEALADSAHLWAPGKDAHGLDRPLCRDPPE